MKTPREWGASAHVTLIRKVTIEAGESKMIPVQVSTPDTSPTNWLLAEPDEEFTSSYGIASLGTLSQAGPSQMLMENLSGHPVTLRKGQTVGTTVSVTPISVRDDRRRSRRTVPLTAREKYSFKQKLYEEMRFKENQFLSEKQKEEMLEILVEHHDVVSKSEFDIGLTNLVTCRIPTEEGKTCKSHLRPLPPYLREDFKTQLQSWIEKDIVTRAPGTGTFSSALVPVRKKCGAVRWCIDYRNLNAITKVDVRPVPNIMDKLASLKQTGKLKVFGTVDLADAYFNIPVHAADQEKTAINTPFGLYQFRRMPFGLAGAPAVFNELIFRLTELMEAIDPTPDKHLSKRVLIYFDDLILTARDWAEFKQVVTLLLKALQKANLKIKPTKTVLGCRSVKFLGHLISDQGLQPDDSLTTTIRNWPKPTNLKEVRALFGTLSYYRKFIRNFAARTANIRKALKSTESFQWTRQAQDEFEELKGCLISKPILSHPDFSPKAKPFILYVDTSSQGIGAVLSQEQEIEHEGKRVQAETVIAYASKSLTSGESHYGAYKLELSGLVFAVTHFRYYLLGKKFKIRTDHKGLEWLRNRPAKALPALIYRWQDVLAEYDFDIEYIPGKKLSHVDGLSRKNYLPLDTGNIKTYPSIPGDDDDDTWIGRMKERVNINSINAIGDRPRRNVPQVQYSDTRTYKPRKKRTVNEPQQQEERVEEELRPPPRMFDPDDDELELEIQDHDMFPEMDNQPEVMEPEVETPSTPAVTSSTEPVQQPDSKTPTLAELQKKDPYWNDLINLFQKKGATQLDYADPKAFLRDLGWNPNSRTKRCEGANNKQTTRLIVKLRNYFILHPDEQILYLTVPLKEHEGEGKRNLYVLPHSEVQQVLKEQHDTLVHPGINGMMNAIGTKFWWPSWKKNVHEFVNSCNICDSIKDPEPRQNVHLGQTTSMGYPRLTRWSVDFVQFPPSGPQRLCYLITLQDFTTRFLETFAVKSPDTNAITKIMTERMIPEYGPFLTLVSDNGRAFVSNVLEKYCTDNKIVRHLCIPYSPRANPVERLHRTLKTKIKCALAETMAREDQWLTVLTKVKAAYNHSPLSDSGLTPAFLKTGRNVAISFPNKDALEQLPTPQEVEQIVTNAAEVQINAMRHRHEQNKRQTDHKVKPLLLKEGDLVDLWRPFDVHHMSATRKMARKWSGPYIVLHHDHFRPHRVLIETHPDVNLPYKKLVVHINHVKLRKPYHGQPQGQKGLGFNLHGQPRSRQIIRGQPLPVPEENDENDENSSDDDDINYENRSEDTPYFFTPGESTMEAPQGEEEAEVEEDTTTFVPDPVTYPEQVVMPPEIFERRSLPASLPSHPSSASESPTSSASRSRTSSTSVFMDTQTPSSYGTSQIFRSPPSGASSSSSIRSRLGPRVDRSESPETPPPQRMQMPTPPSSGRQPVYYRIGEQGPEVTISSPTAMDEDLRPLPTSGAIPKSRTLQRRLGRFAYLEDPTISPPSTSVPKRVLSPPTPETHQAEEKLKKPSKLSKLAQALNPSLLSKPSKPVSLSRTPSTRSKDGKSKDTY
jgi:hypothetical protein